jgi:hypothetical protein
MSLGVGPEVPGQGFVPFLESFKTGERPALASPRPMEWVREEKPKRPKRVRTKASTDHSILFPCDPAKPAKKKVFILRKVLRRLRRRIILFLGK